MSNTKTEAQRLADELRSHVQTYPQMSEDEPGGYCSQDDQLMDEAATELLSLDAQNKAMHKIIDQLRAQVERLQGGEPVTLTDEWVSVGDQKPPTNKPVLLHYLDEHQRSKIVRAHYIPAKTVEAGEDDAAEEYDAESDTYFVQEGWYEDNSESEVNYGITGQITHWRNLPLVPAIIAALREKEQTK